MDLTGNITGAAVDPMSSDWESDTDARAPSTLEKVVANVAVEEIATVLREVSLTQPQHSETPEFSGSADAPATVEQLLLLGTWFLPRPWFQVPALTRGLGWPGWRGL